MARLRQCPCDAALASAAPAARIQLIPLRVQAETLRQFPYGVILRLRHRRSDLSIRKLYLLHDPGLFTYPQRLFPHLSCILGIRCTGSILWIFADIFAVDFAAARCDPIVATRRRADS
jgi:hypothetical protein